MPVSPRLLVLLSFALLLASYVAIFGKFFPLPGFVMGHDHSLALPAYLDGYFWFRNNGLAAPWFTPSFCAGQPFFADPQSTYYSLPQWFSFVVDPVTANDWTLLLCAGLMFWGGFLLLRRVFATGHAPAVLAGGLLMFNAFLPYRIAVGHVGFHGFALVPWLALLLLMPLHRRSDTVAVGVAAGLLLAYWVQGGMGTIMIPAGLGVLVVALLHGLRGGSLARFFLRSLIAVVVALCLSAAKLSAAFALMDNFPRDFYALPGAHSPWDAVVMVFASLFFSAEYVFELMTPRLANLQWALMPHEWAFGFTLAPLVAVLLILRGVPWALLHPAGRRDGLLVALLLACLLWPIAFNTYDPTWNAFLKSLPILGTASTPTRWLILYIPLVAVGAAILLQITGWRERTQWSTAAATLVGTVVLTATAPQDYFLSQNYDARPVVVADALVRAGRLEPQVAALGQEVDVNLAGLKKRLKLNDTFIAGISQVHCYNPIFGYRLEKFSADGLSAGDVLQSRDGYLNLKNPACYVFPKENGCRPGDRFRADQIEEARRFVAYRPFHFQVSERQMLANRLTAWSGGIVALMLLAWTISAACRDSSRRAVPFALDDCPGCDTKTTRRPPS